jgi:hypothetical protein
MTAAFVTMIVSAKTTIFLCHSASFRVGSVVVIPKQKTIIYNGFRV